jgi:transcriptional regulator with XRE-family HTH domain
MADSPSLLVSTKVRGVMAEKRLTQTALAQHLNMPQAAVSDRLRGRTQWRFDELVDVAQILEVPLERVLPLDELATRRAS